MQKTPISSAPTQPSRQASKQAWIDRLERRDANTLVMRCDCTDFRHEVRLEIDANDGWEGPMGTFQLHLIRQPSLFKRIVIAINYLFGRRPLMWGGWYEIDGTLLNEYQLTQLRDFLNEKLSSNGGL